MTTTTRFAVYTLRADGVADWSINDGYSIEEVCAGVRSAGASWTPPAIYLDVRARTLSERELAQVNTDEGCMDWTLAMEDDLRHCRCGRHATWIVGLTEGFDEIYGLTNDVCDAHVVECSRAITEHNPDENGRLTIQRLPFDV